MRSGKKRCVWHIHGFEGVGKTTLIDNFPHETNHVTILEEGTRVVKKKFVLDTGESLDLDIFEISSSCKYSWLDYEENNIEKNIEEFHKSAVCSLFVFDITNMESFERRKIWQGLYPSETDVLLCLIGNKGDLEAQRSVGSDHSFESNMMYFETSGNNTAMVKDFFLMICEISVGRLGVIRRFKKNRTKISKNNDFSDLSSSSDGEEQDLLNDSDEEEEEEEGEEEENKEKRRAIKYKNYETRLSPNLDFSDHMKLIKKLSRREKYFRKQVVWGKLATFKVPLKNKTIYLLRSYVLFKSKLRKVDSIIKDEDCEYLGLQNLELPSIDQIKANMLLTWREDEDLDKIGIKKSEILDYFIFFHQLKIFEPCFFLADNIDDLSKRLAYENFYRCIMNFENELIRKLFTENNEEKIRELMFQNRITRYDFKMSYTRALFHFFDCSVYEDIQRVLMKKKRKEKPLGVLGEIYPYVDSLISHLNVESDEFNDNREIKDHIDFRGFPLDQYDSIDFDKMEEMRIESFINDQLGCDVILIPNDIDIEFIEEDDEEEVSESSDSDSSGDDEEEKEKNKKIKRMKPRKFKLHKSVLSSSSQYFFELFSKNPDLKEVKVKDLNTKCLHIVVDFCYEKEDVFDEDEQDYVVTLEDTINLCLFSIKYKEYRLLKRVLDHLDDFVIQYSENLDIMIFYKYGEQILLSSIEESIKILGPALRGSIRPKDLEWVIRKLEKGKSISEEKRIYKELKKRVKGLTGLVEKQKEMISRNKEVSVMLEKRIKELEQKKKKKKKKRTFFIQSNFRTKQ